MNHDILFVSMAPVDGLLKQLKVVCSGFSVLGNFSELFVKSRDFTAQSVFFVMSADWH